MRNILITLAITLSAAFLLLQCTPPAPEPLPPWEIQQYDDGTTSVLGLRLGHTTLADAQRHLRDTGDIALFADREADTPLRSENVPRRVEVYFKSSPPGSPPGKLIISLTVEDSILAAMHQRARKPQQQASGAIKYHFDPDDLSQLSTATIETIAYLPKIRLEDDVLKQRFGAPDNITYDAPADPDDESTVIAHWEYPALGLTILQSAATKPVLQYRRPSDRTNTVK